MGSLHEGHISLLNRARQECDVVVSSIFVNNLQFGPNEDIKAYPRDLYGDMRKIMSFITGKSLEIMFAPTTEEMYPNPKSMTTVSVHGMNQTYEGKSRPGHFDGVATVLVKLFNIVQPHISFFGQKDAIQCILVKRLVKELNIPMEVEIVPTMRESDGLAMSSRNVYLDSHQRSIAPILNQALKECEKEWKIHRGNMTKTNLLEVAKSILSKQPEAKVDYLSLVDFDSGLEVDEITSSVVLSGVIQLGKTRLLDNIILTRE